MNEAQSISRSQKAFAKRLEDTINRGVRNEDTRFLLRWILELTGLYNPATDEGRRAVGLDIIAQLNEVDPYAYVALMKEGADDVVRMRSKNNREEPGNDDEDA